LKSIPNFSKDYESSLIKQIRDMSETVPDRINVAVIR